MKQFLTGAAVRAVGGFAAVSVSVLTFAFVVGGTIQTAQADLWDGYNHPGIMDVNNNYEYNLKRLPLEGRLKDLPWSETYWPTAKGSINIRWNTESKDGFNYTPPDKYEVMEMSQAQLSRLSASEKYDIYMGRYDYPLWEEARWYGNPKAPDWHGICDGWSIAAIQYKEPAAVTLRNPDGIMVPFGSSDVKALLAFTAAIHFDVESRQVGSKCAGGSRASSSAACMDINAGSLHVVLANQIGLKQQGFITERDPGEEIWNQPTFGYKFQILGSAYSTDGDHGVLVHGTLYYTDELDNSQWDPVVGTDKFKFDKLEMDYVLDLDEDDNIIGGSYLRGSDHPDFVWLPTNRLTFKGTMAGVNQIYKAAH